MSDFEGALDLNSLYQAYKKAKKTSSWKAGVQLYEQNWLINIVKTRHLLESKKYKPSKGQSFTISERGKVRQIRANPFFDRVIRRWFCDYILEPKLYPHLIHDNGASITNKGLSFTQRRFEQKLHEYYRRTGSNDGYILLLDFKKYYDSIDHRKLLEQITKYIDDPDTIWLIKVVVKNFEIDNQPLSLGIGDQCSQVFGTFFPTFFDTYFKNVLSIRNYDRYQDDVAIVHNSKIYLHVLLVLAKEVASKLGLLIHPTKSHIYKLSKGFTFLQRRYRLTRTGHLIKRMNPKRVSAERRRLRKQYNLMLLSKMPYVDIQESFMSWMGSYKKHLFKRTKRELYRLYNDLFIVPFIQGGKYGYRVA